MTLIHVGGIAAIFDLAVVRRQGCMPCRVSNLDLLCILWDRVGNGSPGTLMCRKQQVPIGVRDEQNSLIFPLCGKCHGANSWVLYILVISECSLMPWFAVMAHER